MLTRRVLRMRDLKARRIVNSWPALKNMVENEGFPVGFLLGRNSRAWTEEEVTAWLASRPPGDTIIPRGVAADPAKRGKGRGHKSAKRLAAEAQAQAEARAKAARAGKRRAAQAQAEAQQVKQAEI